LDTNDDRDTAENLVWFLSVVGLGEVRRAAAPGPLPEDLLAKLKSKIERSAFGLRNIPARIPPQPFPCVERSFSGTAWLLQVASPVSDEKRRPNGRSSHAANIIEMRNVLEMRNFLVHGGGIKRGSRGAFPGELGALVEGPVACANVPGLRSGSFVTCFPIRPADGTPGQRCPPSLSPMPLHHLPDTLC